jgi:hypothetical protein
MFDNIDPAVKQYMIFSLLISLIIAAIYNFGIVNGLQGGPLYGFPISLIGAEGLTDTAIRLVNTIIIGVLITPLTYFGVMWALKRG